MVEPREGCELGCRGGWLLLDGATALSRCPCGAARVFTQEEIRLLESQQAEMYPGLDWGLS